MAKAARKKDGPVIEEEKLSVSTPNKAQSNTTSSEIAGSSRQKTEINLEQENRIPAGVIQLKSSKDKNYMSPLSKLDVGKTLQNTGSQQKDAAASKLQAIEPMTN